MYSQGTTITNLLSGGDTEDRGNNGWYNPVTQQCMTTPTSLDGGTKPFIECCYDELKYQVDCNDATKRLTKVPGTFAVYSRISPAGGISKISYVQHTITISNAKNTDFTSVWIEPVTWTASPTYAAGITEISADYAIMTGTANGKPLTIAAPGNSTSFSSGQIDLQLLSPSKDTTVTYNATLTTKGTYVLPNGTINTYTNPTTNTLTFAVTKEEVGFNVVVSLG